MKKENLQTLVFIVALTGAYVGFRLATQAGQGVGVVQNDGYAGAGGALILASGVVMGLILASYIGKPRKK